MSTDDAMSVAVKALRKKHGLSQAGLAQRLGVTPSTVCRWEQGRAAPRVSLAVISAAVNGAKQAPALYRRASLVDGAKQAPAEQASTTVVTISLSKLLRLCEAHGISMSDLQALMEE